MKEAALVIIENELGKILLLDRATSPLGWGLVGGKIEEGESPSAAIHRETLEETGFNFQPNRFIKLGMVESENGRVVHLYYYKLILISEPEPKLSDEHLGYMWVKNFLPDIKYAGNTLKFLNKFDKHVF